MSAPAAPRAPDQPCATNGDAPKGGPSSPTTATSTSTTTAATSSAAVPPGAAPVTENVSAVRTCPIPVPVPSAARVATSAAPVTTRTLATAPGAAAMPAPVAVPPAVQVVTKNIASPQPPAPEPITPGIPIIPIALANGVPMLKVSSKKIKPVNVRLSSSSITWPSLKGGKVDLTAIRELRFGQSPTEEHDGARWITIVYVRDKQWKVVHFVARTDDVYQLWVRALHELVSKNSDKVVSGTEGSTVSDPELRFIRQLWPVGATSIDKTAAAGLCSQLGLVVPAPIAARYEFPLDLSTFRQLVREVQTRPELGEIYERLGPKRLSREGIRAFLKDVQGETDATMNFEAVFQRYADNDQWTSESLAAFLASQDNVPKCKQDLTRPLPEYFIASSHNTYLVAEQWRGSSTVEGYIRTLLAGCRCVEIDCHGGDSDGPIVYHGKTITSSVPIRDVCQAINKYAFVSSPYPVILSLEIRCSVEQQDRLTIIIKECFGDRLVLEPLSSEKVYPSPEDLKGRILIKTKSMPQPVVISKDSILSTSPPTMSPPLLNPSTALATSPPHPHRQDSTSDSTTESDSSFVSRLRRLSFSTTPSKSSSEGHSRTLTELPIYASAVKYKGFSKLVTYEFNHMFSLSENTANRILKDGQTNDWIKHNVTHLTRVYPKGVRLTSSNFDPRPFWNAGAQLVAINYQTQDTGSMYNDALFHAGGYVLKPPYLRQKPAPEAMQQFRLRVHIITAQRLPPMGDLYVEVTVGDETLRTKSTKNSSLTPRWDEQTEFVVSAKPSLLGMTFVHIDIRDKRGTVAQWCRRLADAGRGYRYLPLRDRDRMKYLFATLFARIDVVPITPKVSAPATRSRPQPMFNALI